MFKWIGVSVLILLVVVACLACSTVAVADDSETDGAYRVRCFVNDNKVLDEYFQKPGFKNNDRLLFLDEEGLIHGFSHNVPCIGVWESDVDVKRINGHLKYQKRRQEKHQEASSVY